MNEEIFKHITNNNLKEIKKLLEECPEKIEERIIAGFTPLIEAMAKNRTEIVYYLLEKGANMNARANGDQDAFGWALYHGYNDIAEMMIRKGYDLNRKWEKWAQKDSDYKYRLTKWILHWLHEDKKAEQLKLLGKYEHLMNEEVRKEFKKYRLRALLKS